ncbi:MAG: DUF4830 domain-containing protein [Ruminococcus sp.]|nr:DUF4830 domain-containing protein [Ruminococcus sp.]
MMKKGVLVLGALGFAAGSIWLVQLVKSQSSKGDMENPAITLSGSAARQTFLQEQGFGNAVCVATDTIKLPAQPDENYAAYVTLQERQKLPLTQYLGDTVTRYTYCADDCGTMYIELICTDAGTLAGAMTYDVAVFGDFGGIF